MAVTGVVQQGDYKTEKHVPVIDVPELLAGEIATITVSVGKAVPHPNTPAHFIQWIALYFVPDGGKAIELGRMEFSAHGATMDGSDTGVAHTSPVASFVVRLSTNGTLVAESYCNIHGLWTSDAAVAL